MPLVKIDQSKRENGEERYFAHIFSLYLSGLPSDNWMPSGKYVSLCKALQYCLVLSGKYQHFLQVGISPS